LVEVYPLLSGQTSTSNLAAHRADGCDADGAASRLVDMSAADDCHFCERQTRFRKADVYIENDFCIFFAATRNAELRAEADLPIDVLPGSGAIVPIAHRTSPFDLTAEEWAATHDLLGEAREALHEILAPDGYTLGWNDVASLHAHLHVIPRFHDEPMWHEGVRSSIKIAENRRPDPWRPGSGRAFPGR
jgi:diadenosine tetraphosphate (Ap4A) HIT family hydrolase